MKKVLCLFVTALLLGQGVMAADIASDIRTGGSFPDMHDGGFFEVGLIAGYGYRPRVRDDQDGKGGGGVGVASFEYRYKGVFVEAAQGSLDGLNLGYNIWNNEDWSVDLLALSGKFYGDGDEIGENLGETQRNDWLLDKELGLAGSGLRITGYLGDFIFQYRLANARESMGIFSTARLGRSWQVRNWNFHSIFSLSYASEEYLQYSFGVNSNEATRAFPEYRIKGGAVTPALEVGATYPLGEHWVFRSALRHAPLAGKLRRSPLVTRSAASSLYASISYVF